MASTHEELVEKLRTIRDEMARNPWRERREALRRCLDYELGQLPRPQIRQALSAVKVAFREGESHAGGGKEVSDLRTALDGVQEECERLRAERDRVKRELDQARESDTMLLRLQQENERLQQRLSESGGAGTGLSALRDAVTQLVSGKRPDPAELGLSDDDARLYQALAELLVFAQDNDRSVNMLMLEISGKMESGGTVVEVMARKMFRKLFLESLDGGDDERKKLKDNLQQSIKFQLLMSAAYLNSYRPGVRKILEALDPQTLLDENPGLMGMGHDYAKAFKAFQRRFGDLASMSRDDLWDGYFSPHVRKQLSDYLDQLPQT